MKAGVKYGNTSPVLRDINDSERSPFKNLLDWQYNNQGTKLVPLTAIEQSLRYLKAKFKFLDEDDDSLVEIFFAIWRSVKNEYEQLWGKDNDNKDNRLMKKVSINALNEYIVDNLFTSWTMGLVDIFDSQSVEKQVSNMMKLLPIEFWESQWSVKLQDSVNVRELIKEDLSMLASNYRMKKNWRENLELPILNDIQSSMLND